MSDRVYVMREGSITGELNGKNITRKHYDLSDWRQRRPFER